MLHPRTALTCIFVLASLGAASCTGGDSASDSEPTYADTAAAEAASAKAAVDEAIDHYDAEGLQAALDRHNSADNVEGERYVFVIDAGTETMIGHWDDVRRGESLRDWLGTDLHGYEFGSEMLSADEDGKWVTYTFVPPDALAVGSFAEGNLHIKHSWVRRHDGLLFGSGWYMDADGFIEAVVDAAADVVADGVPDDLTAQLDLGGLADAIPASMAYYNATEVSDGLWLGFVAARDGLVVSAEHNPELVGTDITDLLGAGVLDGADPVGEWIIEAGPQAAATSVRVYARTVDDLVIAAGWYQLVSNG